MIDNSTEIKSIKVSGDSLDTEELWEIVQNFANAHNDCTIEVISNEDYIQFTIYYR